MGSCGPETDESSDEIHILLTGFGPFRDNPINPSYLIAQSLPAILPPPSKPTSVPLPTIYVHTHPQPIRVAYATVRSTIPSLLFPQSDATTFSPNDSPAYDLILHMGMAPGREYYTLETVAHRDGYEKEDVDRRTMREDRYWREEVGSPEVLEPRWEGWSGDDVWRRWKGGLMDEDVRPSRDAGRYLCDFIFYTGLVEYWRRDPEGDLPVVFLHVPGAAEEADVERGTRVTAGLIRALVENKRAKTKVRRLDIELEYSEM